MRKHQTGRRGGHGAVLDAPSPLEDPLIEYPRSNERLHLGQYTFRIFTEAEGPVEVSLNGGSWQTCRPAAGYWWHDWHASAAGRYWVVARVKGPDGKYRQSHAVCFSADAEE